MPTEKQQKKRRPLKFHEPEEKDPAKRVEAIRRATSRIKTTAKIDFMRDVRGKR